MANPNSDGASHTTERETAPATVTSQWVMPRQKMVERMGGSSSPMVHHFPQVRGGICEFCGVIDRNQPSEYQYKMCPHYRGMQLACSYCPESKDQNEVITRSTLNVAEHPDNPSKLVVWCNSFECADKHIKRFKVNT